MGVFVVYLKRMVASVCLLGLTAAVSAQAREPEREPGARIVVAPKPVQKRVNPPIPAPEPQQSPAADNPAPAQPVKAAPPIAAPSVKARINPAPVAQPTGEIAPSVDMIESPPPVVMATAQDVGPVGPAKPAGDFAERVELAHQLLEIDGTEAIIRHFVGEVHMRLIIGEVGKYIDVNSLNESDRYRLATIVATVSTELGDKILLLTARGHAQNLSKEELLYLARVSDSDAQRKLTQMRIDDTGELDKNAELVMQISALKIVQEFEKP